MANLRSTLSRISNFLAFCQPRSMSFLLQGYLSFWNENISYALRGCILIELAIRRRIAVVKDPHRRRGRPSERLVHVIDDRQTGETILDETLRIMKAQQEKLSINDWVDLLSGACTMSLLLAQELTCSVYRRNMECSQDRLSAKSGPRTTC